MELLWALHRTWQSANLFVLLYREKSAYVAEGEELLSKEVLHKLIKELCLQLTKAGYIRTE